MGAATSSAWSTWRVKTLGRLMKKTIDSPLPLAAAARADLSGARSADLYARLASPIPDGTPLLARATATSVRTTSSSTFDGAGPRSLDFRRGEGHGGQSTPPRAGMFQGASSATRPPEQILGNSEQRSDVFAVGVSAVGAVGLSALVAGTARSKKIVQARMGRASIPELMKQGVGGGRSSCYQICTRRRGEAGRRPLLRPPWKWRDALRGVHSSQQSRIFRRNNCAAGAERPVRKRTPSRSGVLVDQRMKQGQSGRRPPFVRGRKLIPVAPASAPAASAEPRSRVTLRPMCLPPHATEQGQMDRRVGRCCSASQALPGAG